MSERERERERYSVKRVQPFALGDVVTATKERGDRVIIEIRGGHNDLTYGLSPGGFWFDHTRLTLVREADRKSLKEVRTFWE